MTLQFAWNHSNFSYFNLLNWTRSQCEKWKCFSPIEKPYCYLSLPGWKSTGLYRIKLTLYLSTFTVKKIAYICNIEFSFMKIELLSCILQNHLQNILYKSRFKYIFFSVACFFYVVNVEKSVCMRFLKRKLISKILILLSMSAWS